MSVTKLVDLFPIYAVERIDFRVKFDENNGEYYGEQKSF